MSKELWFAEYERLLNEKEDAGMLPEQAEEQAADEAFDALTDRLADQADLLRKQQRENQ